MKKFAEAFIYATIETWTELNFAQRFVITLVFFILGMLLVDYYVHGEPIFKI